MLRKKNVLKKKKEKIVIPIRIQQVNWDNLPIAPFSPDVLLTRQCATFTPPSVLLSNDDIVKFIRYSPVKVLQL